MDEKHTEENNLNFNMETDSNINTIQEEPHETKKTRGRPKKEAQHNINLNTVSNKLVLNLEDKLTKLKRAEAEYNKALEQLRK